MALVSTFEFLKLRLQRTGKISEECNRAFLEAKKITPQPPKQNLPASLSLEDQKRS